MKLSTLELHKVPDKISEVAATLYISAAKFKRAIVVREHQKNFRFFETVSLNRGQNIKMFNNRDEAKEWLLKK